MPVETDADRAVFVDVDDFGVSVTWTKAGGGVSTLPAIFDAEYQLLTGTLLEEGAEGASPHIVCRSADLPSGAAQGDTVTIGSADYRVVEMRPDGTGISDIRLLEA